MKRSKYIAMEIGRTNSLLKRNYYSIRRQIEKTTGKNSWIIMFLMEHSNEDIFQKDIEHIFSIRRSTASNMLKLMEKKGYIRREPVDYDARLKKIVLTKPARDMFELLTEQLDEKESLLRRNISEDEIAIFFSVLDRIQENITGS